MLRITKSILIVSLIFGSMMHSQAQDSSPMTYQNIDYCEFQKRQKNFSSIDGELKYIDEGASEQVVLLLHGVPTSGWLYRKMIDSLRSSGFRVIVPDMLGFGSSASPKGYDLYKPEAHAKRLLALMDSLGIESWCHVCHDFGGMVTWEIIRQDAKRVRELVLLNTIIYDAGFQPPVRFNRGPIAHIAMSLYRSRLTNKFMLKQLFKVGLHKTKLSKTEYKGYQWPLLNGKTRAMYTFFTSIKDGLPDYSAITKAIDIPLSVVWGQHDKILVWDTQSTAVMSDLRLKPQQVHIIDASHFIQEEDPAAVCDKIIITVK